MRQILFEDRISRLDVSMPPEEIFFRMGDLTALRQDSDGNFYRSNYSRGPLLYSLVAKFKPKVILEFGTGRGYGALCMAKALVEHSIDGIIYTLDMRSYQDKSSWWIDFGTGPEIQHLAWSDVWPNYFDPAWLDRISCLTGTSYRIMGKWERLGLPRIDFAFIDGGHDYLTVKHDFYSVLQVANSDFRVLFDDYVEMPRYGTVKLVNEEIEPVFEVELIQSPNASPTGPDSKAGMVFIDSQRIKSPWPDVFTSKGVQKTLFKYRMLLNARQSLQSARGVLKPLKRLFSRNA